MQRAHPTDPSRSVDFDADKQTKKVCKWLAVYSSVSYLNDV